MNSTLTLLYVEDDNDTREQLSTFLKYFSSSLYIAIDGEEGLSLYKKYSPDLIITDIGMPKMDGVTMVEKIKQINPHQHIIFTTAHSESTFFIRAIDVSVDGYILKPIDLEKLEYKIKRIQEHINLKKFYIQHQKELEHKAYIDELTQIHNRTYFEETLSKEIAKFKREVIKEIGFILFDIDHFKNFNDKYGHQKGDEILKELALLIKNETRISDIFARWGGEEFVNVLPGNSLQATVEVAKKLCRKIEKHIFSGNLHVTCSFGVTTFSKDDTKETLLKKADKALYVAKNKGRNQVQVYRGSFYA